MIREIQKHRNREDFGLEVAGQKSQATPIMFTEAEIRRVGRRRACLLVPGLFVGMIGVFGCLALMANMRDGLVDWTFARWGPTAAEFAPAALPLFSIVAFITPLWIMERAAKRWDLFCPHCSANLMLAGHRLLITRCCRVCGTQIVAGGKPRDAKVYRRYVQTTQRRSLVYWFWVWPAFAMLALVVNGWNPTALANCPHMLVLPGLVGTVATGWAILRTRDRHYLPQLVASTVLLLVGSWLFWNTF